MEGKGANVYTTSKLNVVLKIVDNTKVEVYDGPITMNTIGKKMTDIKDVFDVILNAPGAIVNVTGIVTWIGAKSLTRTNESRLLIEVKDAT